MSSISKLTNTNKKFEPECNRKETLAEFSKFLTKFQKISVKNFEGEIKRQETRAECLKINLNIFNKNFKNF